MCKRPHPPISTQVQRLENRYEEEKRRAREEVERLRQRAAEREAALQRMASRQVEVLGQQVCTCVCMRVLSG
jgi:hypothetical protein